ncbi:MAG TPA: IclR family transcriptional regulator C-terminal domain-containing protein, partial [Thermomicrobiales bacterium]|nr:IclR family transcriptional regulator C-terminal domain-containing protein [Thermomicrobiales bacterium]
HLGILYAGRVVVAAQAEGAGRVRLSVAVGSAVPPLQAASGRVLLAALDAASRDRLLTEDAEWRDMGDRAHATLRRRLETIRERGYEEARGESVAGVSDLSVPVGPPGLRTQAALAVTALPRDHVAWVAATLPILRRTAATICAAAGLRGLGAAADEETRGNGA